MGVLEKAASPDVIVVVVAYGRILPQWMLDFASLWLPQCAWIVAAEVSRGSADSVGDRERRNRDRRDHHEARCGLDTGDVLLERVVPVGPDDTAAEMYPKLAAIGAGVMLETLRRLEDGTLGARAQDHAAATLAPILTREDGRLDLARTARQTYDRWRGFSPWPGCFGEFRGKRLLLWKLRPAELDSASIAPGELMVRGDALLMGAAQDTALQLDEVQLEGKARMSGRAFYKDFQVKAGERVG